MISASGISAMGKKTCLNAQRLRVIPDFEDGILLIFQAINEILS